MKTFLLLFIIFCLFLVTCIVKHMLAYDSLCFLMLANANICEHLSANNNNKEYIYIIIINANASICKHMQAFASESLRLEANGIIRIRAQLSLKTSLPFRTVLITYP